MLEGLILFAKVHGWRRVFAHTSPQLFAHSFTQNSQGSTKVLNDPFNTQRGLRCDAGFMQEVASVSMEQSADSSCTVSLLEVPQSDGMAFFQSKYEFSVAEVLLVTLICHSVYLIYIFQATPVVNGVPQPQIKALVSTL